MKDAHKPFWIGALAGLAVAVVASPAAVLFWNAYSSDRAATQAQLAELSQRLDKNNQALIEMQKVASLAGVTQQLMELNGRIKAANEALAELQKTSAGIQRASLDKIADRLDRVDGSLKTNAEAVAALQKSAPLANLSKQLAQLQANFASFDIQLAEFKTNRPADPSKRLEALETSVKAVDARLDEIKHSLDAANAAASPAATAPAAAAPPAATGSPPATPSPTPPRLRPRG
jgi:DNA repair exonuclease SbcCD ATPase subunit